MPDGRHAVVELWVKSAGKDSGAYPEEMAKDNKPPDVRSRCLPCPHNSRRAVMKHLIIPLLLVGGFVGVLVGVEVGVFEGVLVGVLVGDDVVVTVGVGEGPLVAVGVGVGPPVV